ncbi:hypothetical protein ENUP19_0080G0006 [Entamoeba nuttalli]|uniref:Uncharacterized protein n=2 Tax=Entamoeba nuttalli TaxID=412467 RepID=K2G4Q5_ENTNP|nr:hypothetical protein ENU1_202930 [Entamoeba nuttalli P19]EKE37286.1 hypothetical protein ENU1_202930 [Entamoeba nuttalli P19]|eukprot:XP_008860384.1 hypothetical protein ENU1_202930 [Entamoeba nuttalli P19]
METTNIVTDAPNVGEHGQTKIDYYDLKLKYKNLKNEVGMLEKKKKVYEKHNVPTEDKEMLDNEITTKQNELQQAKTMYKEKKSQRMKEIFHRSA